MEYPADRSTARTGAHRRALSLSDPAAIGLVLVIATVMSRSLLPARDLQTGAGDWPAHAFRIREVLDNGVASWSHVWAGGMPLWEGYQALPHLLTAAMVRMGGIEPTRAMALAAGLLLIALRVGVYLVCRWLGAPPLAALLGALTLCAFDTVRQPLANFSELWGLALAPFVLYAGYRWAGRPGGFVIAALAGIAVEVHPLLAVTGALALAAGWCASPAGRSPALLAGQAAVAALGSAVFWLPVATSSRPAYTEPYFASPEFARLLLSLATAGFIAGWLLVAAGAALAGTIALRRRTDQAAVRFLLIVGACVSALTLIGIAPGTPEVVREAQLVRLVALAPLLIGMLVAILARGSNGRIVDARPGWGVATALAALALMRGLGGPLPLTGADVHAGPLERVWEEFDPAPITRVYADPPVTARASSWAGDRVRFAGSYSGREWSILHGPIEYFLAGDGDARTRAAYLIAHAVEYALLPAGARPAIADPASGAPVEWRLIAGADGLDLLRAPWSPPIAWHMPASEREGLTAPDGRFRDVPSSYVRDVTVRRFAARSLAGDTGRATVAYPDSTSIVIRVSGLDGDRYLVVNENWDRMWRATASGRRLPLERFGPNLIGVDLRGLEGDTIVILEHRRPPAAVLGLLLTALALPVGAMVDRITRRHAARRNR